MTEKIKKVFEELTKDCTQEEKAKILQIVEPGEPGKRKKHVSIDYTSAEFERLTPILDGILAAMREAAALEGKYKTKAALFKKQLEEARIFREKHYKNGLELIKLRVLLEIARDSEPWDAIANAFNYGYMVGYKAAQRNARKKAKAAAANQEGAKRA